MVEHNVNTIHMRYGEITVVRIVDGMIAYYMGNNVDVCYFCCGNI